MTDGLLWLRMIVDRRNLVLNRFTASQGRRVRNKAQQQADWMEAQELTAHLNEYLAVYPTESLPRA